MAPMTSKERIPRILRRQPVDRIGLVETFWPEAVARWREEGRLGPDESPQAHFGIETRDGGWPIMTADLDWKYETKIEDGIQSTSFEYGRVDTVLEGTI